MALNLVPTAGQTLLQTRDPIYNNFSFINTQYAVDHVAFNSGGDSGKHNQITFPTGASIATPSATELVLYNATNATTARSEIYLRRNSGSDLPFTATKTTNPSAGLYDGYTYLPSGLLIKYGIFQVSGTGSGVYTYTSAVGFSAAPYCVQLTISGGTGSNSNRIVLNGTQATTTIAYIVNITGGGFFPATVHFMAIGPA